MLAAARALERHFAGLLIAWQRRYGRRALPWQNTRDPYRVWLSEIMLQQTQVATVLGYYPRFVQRFPDVAALAAASLDEVLALWSGLGYYSRARNLHRCAGEVMGRWQGVFPHRAQELATLPGIGRSTAAAIAVFCFGERAAILDGNVRRVLARVLAFEGDLARASQQNLLWDAAQLLLPASADTLAPYTQGLMDLGATVCLPRQPDCARCPVRSLCRARELGAVERFPLRSRKLSRSTQSLWLLLAWREDGAVWLEKRPPHGIWAGLYGLPAFDSRDSLHDACAAVGTAPAGAQQELPAFSHALTHRELHLHPVRWQVAAAFDRPLSPVGQWAAPAVWTALGLPAPVRRLLQQQAGF